MAKQTLLMYAGCNDSFHCMWEAHAPLTNLVLTHKWNPHLMILHISNYSILHIRQVVLEKYIKIIGRTINNTSWDQNSDHFTVSILWQTTISYALANT